MNVSMRFFCLLKSSIEKLASVQGSPPHAYQIQLCTDAQDLREDFFDVPALC